MKLAVFLATAGALFATELLWIVLADAGMPQVWLNAPNPISAFAVSMVCGVAVPSSALSMLWCQEKSNTRFLFLAAAAATLGYGSVVGLSVVLTLLPNGLPVTADMVPGLLCAAVSLLCLACWKALGSPEEPSTQTA